MSKKANERNVLVFTSRRRCQKFNLLTGDLDYSNAADGHYPYKAAALVALTEGKPSFLGWRNPENPPAP